MMLRTTYSVIPAQSLPRTRSPSVIPAEAGIHCPAVRLALPVNCVATPSEIGKGTGPIEETP